MRVNTDLYSEHAYWKATIVPALDAISFFPNRHSLVPKETSLQNLKKQENSISENFVLQPKKKIIEEDIGNQLERGITTYYEVALLETNSLDSESPKPVLNCHPNVLWNVGIPVARDTHTRRIARKLTNFIRLENVTDFKDLEDKLIHSAQGNMMASSPIWPMSKPKTKSWLCIVHSFETWIDQSLARHGHVYEEYMRRLTSSGNFSACTARHTKTSGC
ncbi:hypothetical protein Tco_0318766 [Tanacetum coccineum]